MRDDALVLIGREDARSRGALGTHARRLEDRDIVDAVHAVRYEHEPERELVDDLAAVAAESVYAVPVFSAHIHETTDAIPAALSAVSGEVRYCDPVGRSPAVTDALLDRAAGRLPPDDGASLVLVGFGNSSQPYQRQVVEYHAARIREEGAYDEVVPCYLLQNPAVECVRYNVSNDRAVAVPVFVARSEATEERIPAKLELDRGGIEYADPLGEHPRVTDAIHAKLERRRVLASGGPSSPSIEASLVADTSRIATDGEGGLR